jgi:hypothetical protein
LRCDGFPALVRPDGSHHFHSRQSIASSMTTGFFRNFTHSNSQVMPSNVNVNLNFQQLVQAVRQLSVSDKLRLNEKIWDGEFDIPMEHQRMVLDRMKKSGDTPGRMLDWDEASETLIP